MAEMEVDERSGPRDVRDLRPFALVTRDRQPVGPDLVRRDAVQDRALQVARQQMIGIGTVGVEVKSFAVAESRSIRGSEAGVELYDRPGLRVPLLLLLGFRDLLPHRFVEREECRVQI